MRPLVPVPLALPAPRDPESLAGRAVAPAPAQDDDGWTQPQGLPPVEKITYVKEAITTLLLILALPWLLYRLLTNPGQLVRGIGRKHTG